MLPCYKKNHVADTNNFNKMGNAIKLHHGCLIRLCGIFLFNPFLLNVPFDPPENIRKPKVF